MWATASSAGVAARGDRAVNDEETLGNDIAERMGRSANSLSMMRRSLIKKGMIFSPSIGMVAYTVPMFGAYMMRMSSVQGLRAVK